VREGISSLSLNLFNKALAVSKRGHIVKSTLLAIDLGVGPTGDRAEGPALGNFAPIVSKASRDFLTDV
jgi:hypothetical protein